MNGDCYYCGTVDGPHEDNCPNHPHGRKPNLTSVVMGGLGHLAGVAEAGSPDDILGGNYDCAAADSEYRRDWTEVERAVEWIRAMQHYRDWSALRSNDEHQTV